MRPPIHPSVQASGPGTLTSIPISILLCWHLVLACLYAFLYDMRIYRLYPSCCAGIWSWRACIHSCTHPGALASLPAHILPHWMKQFNPKVRGLHMQRASQGAAQNAHLPGSEGTLPRIKRSLAQLHAGWHSPPTGPVAAAQGASPGAVQKARRPQTGGALQRCPP